LVWTQGPWFASSRHRRLDHRCAAPAAELPFHSADHQGADRGLLARRPAAERFIEVLGDVNRGAHAHDIIMARQRPERHPTQVMRLVSENRKTFCPRVLYTDSKEGIHTMKRVI